MKLWDSPIIRMLVSYIISSLGITSLAFFIVFPYTSNFLYHTDLLPFGNLFTFLERIPQYLIYAAVTALFYFMVARPFRLSPVLGKVNSARHWIIVFICICVAFVSVTPFQDMFTVSSGIGILTFMITGLSEEWTYRGVIIRVIKDRVGIVWAVLISAILFAMSHWAEVSIVGGNKLFSQGGFIALGQDLLMGLVFGIIVWRSRSILWAASLHCMADWQPYYTSAGRGWMLDLHIPWLQIGFVQIYLMGLIGAEIIRFCSNVETTKVRGKEIVDTL